MLRPISPIGLGTTRAVRGEHLYGPLVDLHFKNRTTRSGHWFPTLLSSGLLDLLCGMSPCYYLCKCLDLECLHL
jgi:hypothetical protein